MLVIEQGRDAVAAPKHRHDFVEEPFAREFLLALGVNGIFPVFANRQYAIDRQLFSAQTKRASDGRIDFDVVFGGYVARHVAFGKLVHVKTHDLHPG